MPPPISRQPDELSPAAIRVLGVLRGYRERHGPGQPLTDATIAYLANVGVRDVIDLALELLRRHHLVIASCDRTKPGRYLLRAGDDLAPALRYLESLQRRAKAIFGRFAHLRDALRATGQLELPLSEPRPSASGQSEPRPSASGQSADRQPGREEPA